jgi:hypothetical protein
MAKLSAYDRLIIARLEKTFPHEGGGCDQTKVTYCFMTDRKILWKVGFHYPADEFRSRPKWESSGYRVKGQLKEGLDPKESVFYRSLISAGYQEISCS